MAGDVELFAAPRTIVNPIPLANGKPSPGNGKVSVPAFAKEQTITGKPKPATGIAQSS